LLRTKSECGEFGLPNGGYTDQGEAEFIDYATGRTWKEDAAQFARPPVPLPRSETEGLPILDVQSNVLGNLPSIPKGYVERRSLQEELKRRLLDTNHHIVTLHGRGGIGKTSLALFVTHRLAAMDPPHFEHIIWFSARDIDLRPSGPTQVKPADVNLEAIGRKFGELFEAPKSVDFFARFLESPFDQLPYLGSGVLFVFDNFETMDDIAGIHEFLDTHTHIPNKVLITSRERAFKADYNIEVRGMEVEEANQMLTNAAAELQIAELVTQDVIAKIYESTDGHPYVMRVILGEMAKERRVVPMEQLIPRRRDIVDTVFERSFGKLSDDGRWVFLAVSNWRSVVLELALQVVLGQRGKDARLGLEECELLSLVTRDYLMDGQAYCYTPKLARIFGKKKLEGDPDRLSVNECIEVLQRFGVVSLSDAGRTQQDTLIRQFVKWCFREPFLRPDRRLQVDSLLEGLAHNWPEGWLALAKYREQHDLDAVRVEYALRRAVEEMPLSKEARLARARFARDRGDESTFVSSMVSAADVDPNDIGLLRETAGAVSKYVDDYKDEIPPTRRSVYLASVRSHMEKVASKLDATGLSRLSWLYLLEGREAEARKYAEDGCRKDKDNEHCKKILERLDRSRWR
jgi:hypothetical protein